jgi:hypothetical protein
VNVTTAIEVLDGAVRDCKKKNVQTPEVYEALNLLQRVVSPAWLILQFRNALDRRSETDLEREGQRQVLGASLNGIRRCCLQWLHRRIDQLARQYSATRDEKTMAQLADVSRRVGKLKS